MYNQESRSCVLRLLMQMLSQLSSSCAVEHYTPLGASELPRLADAPHKVRKDSWIHLIEDLKV